MRALCVIPARGGSKGLPGKNLRTAGGLSLVARAVRCAREFLWHSGLTDGTVLVDTDDAAIAEEGRRWGASVPFLRPGTLAGDDTPTAASTLHCLDRLESEGERFDAVLLLQPTSPLREPVDVSACWKVFRDGPWKSVVSITPVEHPVELTLRMDASGVVDWREPRGTGGLRRQDFAPAFRLTGGVYIIAPDLLREHRSFLLPGLTRGVTTPPERATDVDSAADLRRADQELRELAPSPVRLGRRVIGASDSCFIIGRVPVDRDGYSVRELIAEAATAGADAVSPIDADESLAIAGRQPSRTGSGPMLPRETWSMMAEEAARQGLPLVGTPNDEGGADLLEELGVSAFRIPGRLSTSDPAVADLARRGRPILLLTAGLDMLEIAKRLDVLRENGNPRVAILHGRDARNEAPSSVRGLLQMAAARGAFRVPVGWSERAVSFPTALAATAFGARLLELTFGLGDEAAGVGDAAGPSAVDRKELIRAIRLIDESRTQKEI